MMVCWPQQTLGLKVVLDRHDRLPQSNMFAVNSAHH